MTIQEFDRAKTLLSKEQLAELDGICPGKWAVYNEDGIVGLYTTKASGISDMLDRHTQSRSNSKSYRHGSGSYTLCVLDIDSDPSEKFYHTYSVKRITERNLQFYKELCISAMLPIWYFNPYSREYKEWNNQDQKEAST